MTRRFEIEHGQVPWIAAEFFCAAPASICEALGARSNKLEGRRGSRSLSASRDFGS